MRLFQNSQFLFKISDFYFKYKKFQLFMYFTVIVKKFNLIKKNILKAAQIRFSRIIYFYKKNYLI